jgi:hypothetical protein
MFGIVLIIAQAFPTIRRGRHDMCVGVVVNGGGEVREVMSAFGTASELRRSRKGGRASSGRTHGHVAAPPQWRF